MDSVGSYSLKALLSASLSAGLLALAFGLPGVSHRWAAATAILVLGANLVAVPLGLIRGERRPRTMSVPRALIAIAVLGSAGIAISWIVDTTAPLAFAGALLLGVELEALLAAVFGRTTAVPLGNNGASSA